MVYSELLFKVRLDKCSHPTYTAPMDDNFDRERPSRLLLHLKQIIGNSEVPVGTMRGQRNRARDGRAESQREDDKGLELNSLPDSFWERLAGLGIRYESELAFANSYLEEDPPRSRVALLLANSSELRRVAILQLYIERAYSFRLHEPHEGLRITDDLLAWTEADPSSLVSVIRARAFMERGNFLRILADQDGASAAFAQAWRTLEESGAGDPLEIARYQELLGTLERDCGNYAIAADLLRKALGKIRRWGDSHSLQRVLISASLADLYNNNSERAHRLLDEALSMEEHDGLFLRYAAVNKVLVYLYDGEPHRAYRYLLRLRGGLGEAWMQGFPEAGRIGALWIEAQVLSALRLDDEAIALFNHARNFYIQAAYGYEVGHISIEMALNYAAQEKYGEAARELAFALPFCSAQKARDHYARAALILLQQTIQEQGRLKAGQIHAASQWLELFRRAPLKALRQPPTLTDLLLQ